MNCRRVLATLACAGLVFAAATSEAETRRFLLAAGANDGGNDRVALRYAVTDAENFARTMVEMGGVRADDRIVLDEPGRASLEAAIDNLAYRIAGLPQSADRAEVLFYYSGHADESGLLIGKDRVSYADLKTRIDAIPAVLRITILDACASGAITRIKGGERRPAFLIDDSTDMEGYAFLTSSSPNEAAQESDLVGASFFTHFLVSGLRGAADVSGEGKVSLTEAYQFAFNETLARTTETQGGAQHPAYHINMSGTGDVVMTDIRETSAGLILEKDLRGRFFIRDSDNHLVAELYKPRGRLVTIGLDAGEYRVHMSREPDLWVAHIELADEDRLTLDADHFAVTDRDPIVMRGHGGAWPPRPGFLGPLAGRSRLEILVGKHGVGFDEPADASGAVAVEAGSQDLMLGLGYSRWLREDLALGLSLIVLEADVEASVGPSVSTSALSLTAIRVGLKKYVPRSLLRTPYRAYLSVEAEALLAGMDSHQVGAGSVETSTKNLGAYGVVAGLGVDFILGRRLMVGAKAGYAAVTDFPEPLAGRRNYSSFEATVNLSWLFGSGF